MSLSSLGLTGFEERVYRVLLRGGDPEAVGGPDDVRAAVTRLVELGLARTEGDEVRPVAAEVGVARLIRRRMREANAELRRISQAWEVVPALATEQRGAYDAVERIESPEQVEQRIWSLALDAHEVMAVHHLQRQVHTTALPRYLRRLGEGVRWRTILPRARLRDPATAEYYALLHRSGDRHRVTDEAVQQMVILDRAVAFVPIEPDTHGSGALVLRQAGAVATLVDLFERVWAHAEDLEPGESARLTERERRVLRLLATAVKDETSAREMGVSLRTYRRYVAELLARLGAANRVQAAVIAKQRGWV